MNAKLKLDIPLVLPEVSDVADACMMRLTSAIAARPGVEEAHVVGPAGDGPPVLCIHYDPELISISRIRGLAHSAGAAITSRFGHQFWTVRGIGFQRRARTVSQRLSALRGVIEAEASTAGLVRVEYDREQVTPQRIIDELASLDVAIVERIVPVATTRTTSADAEPLREATGMYGGIQHRPGENDTDHTPDQDSFLGSNSELIFALGCGAALSAGFAIEKLVPGVRASLPTALYLISYALGSFFTIREAIDNLKLRKFEIDTLMLAAAIGAATLGAFAEGALLLFLFSIGHALERLAMARAKRVIETLVELAPKTAIMRRADGTTEEIPVESLAVGDIVVIKPDERVPADGFLVKGVTVINQAPLTGESMPVNKRAVMDDEAARANPTKIEAASRVFAGTINGNGLIEIEVTRLASETTLAKFVKMVSEGETQKSPTQRFTNRLERVFVAVALSLAFVLLFAWVVVDEPFRDSFYRAMAVLVAASPCALAIATPSAVLSAVARAALGGVLLKGGAPLEMLGSLNVIAFDKTGTLTMGEPRVQEIITAPGVANKELMAIAVAVESLSDHPLAQAIVRNGREYIGRRSTPDAEDLKSLTGRGVSALVDGDLVLIGKAEMFGAEGVAPLCPAMVKAIEKLRAAAQTTMVVRKGDRDIGAIGLMDTPRVTAREAFDRLRGMGIARMIMISGDHQRAAQAVAARVGITEAWGDLTPEDKVEVIKKLRADTKVAMVGKGVNDAAAMASATVGIAIGAAESDVALDTADVALMTDDISHLPFAIGLSRHTRSVIRQNVFVSFGVVALLVPATILGLGIGPAIALHEGSTLLVVVNALRLLAYREPRWTVSGDSRGHSSVLLKERWQKRGRRNA